MAGNFTQATLTPGVQLTDEPRGWRKASRSMGNGNCLEASSDGAVRVRDSADRQGPELTFTVATWRAFLGTLRREPHAVMAGGR